MGSRILAIVLLVGNAFGLMALAPRLAGYRLPGDQEGYEPAQPIAFSHRLHAGEMQIACVYCHSGAERGRLAGIPSASVCMNCHRSVTAPLAEVREEEEQAKKENRKRRPLGPTHLLGQALGAQALAPVAGPMASLTQTLVAVELEESNAFALPPRPLVSPELRKLYDALGLDEKLQPDPKKSPRPIAWIRVYNLPDFACFDHRAHVGAGVACQRCHGPVESMERVRQVGSLSMGWCVNCHREASQTGVAGKKVSPSIDCATCHY
jgi:hypothetical protein